MDALLQSRIASLRRAQSVVSQTLAYLEA